MKIKELDKEFVKRGIKYTQVEKNDLYVVYRCENQEYKEVYLNIS